VIAEKEFSWHMLETALHWKRMISAQTVALKKMHLYVVPTEMHTGKEIYVKFNSFCSDQIGLVGVEVFAVVTMKNGVFWEVTPCGSCKNRRFGGT
jgi:hypothetical protein